MQSRRSSRCEGDKVEPNEQNMCGRSARVAVAECLRARTRRFTTWGRSLEPCLDSDFLPSALSLSLSLCLPRWHLVRPFEVIPSDSDEKAEKSEESGRFLDLLEGLALSASVLARTIQCGS